MDILCARHGNTFGPGDRVVFVGANEDLPLTAAGEEQARALAKALNDSGVAPAVVYAGPLKRQWRYAEILVANLARRPVPLLDSGLSEIDYGDWASRTNDEVEAMPGQAKALKSWNDRNVWPKSANWGGSEEGLRGEIAAFLDVLREAQGEILPPDAAVLVVGSNGVLRFLAMAALGPDAENHPQFPFKIRTGNVGKLIERAGRYDLAYWDRAPRTSQL
jgi:probable phosphoglycerate mutase